MDYEFFQILSQRIEKAEGEEKQQLTEMRDKMLNLTQEVDRRLQEQLEQSRSLLNDLISAENIEQATAEALPEMDDFFAETLRAELQQANQSGDRDRMAKLQRVVSVLQQASAPPPELALAEELMGAESEEDRKQIMQENAEAITPEFLQMLTTLMGQVEQQGQPELSQRLQEVYRSALRFSMQANLKK
jgi:hypothetical protein